MSPVIISIVAIVLLGLAVATYFAPRLTSVIVWALIAAVLAGSAAMLALPFPFREVAVWMTLIVPLIWVGFQFWCYWERRSWRVVAGLVSVSALSGLTVLISAPPV